MFSGFSLNYNMIEYFMFKAKPIKRTISELFCLYIYNLCQSENIQRTHSALVATTSIKKKNLRPKIFLTDTTNYVSVSISNSILFYAAYNSTSLEQYCTTEKVELWIYLHRLLQHYKNYTHDILTLSCTLEVLNADCTIIRCY